MEIEPVVVTRNGDVILDLEKSESSLRYEPDRKDCRSNRQFSGSQAAVRGRREGDSGTSRQSELLREIRYEHRLRIDVPQSSTSSVWSACYEEWNVETGENPALPDRIRTVAQEGTVNPEEKSVVPGLLRQVVVLLAQAPN